MLDWFRTDLDTAEEDDRPSGPVVTPDDRSPGPAATEDDRSPDPAATPDGPPSEERPDDPPATTDRQDHPTEQPQVQAPEARSAPPVTHEPIAPQRSTTAPDEAPASAEPPRARPEPPQARPEPPRAQVSTPQEQGRAQRSAPEAPPAGARIVCIANQKGGVGKTTTAVSLAAALADAGAQVLLVDLDPQGNATTGLGLRPQEGAPSTYRVLIEEMPVEDATEPTSVQGLHCLPSSLDLAGAEIELVSVFNRERRLGQGLEEVRDLYDVILIDCPPTLGLLTINALAAADSVILPIQCEYYALEGVGQLTRTVDLVRRGLNPSLEVGGVVLTMYDGRTKLSEQVADEVRSHFPSEVFRTIIPRTVRLSEAPSYGQPITVYDPSSRGARAYQRLADELAQRLELGVQGLSPLDDLLGIGADDEEDATVARAEDATVEPEDEERWA